MSRKLLLVPLLLLVLAGVVRGQDDPVVGKVGPAELKAWDVLAPLDRELYQLSLTLKRDIFLGRARGLVSSRLDQLIVDTLILQRAEKTLSEEEKNDVEQQVQAYRAQLASAEAGGNVAGDTPEAREAELARLVDGRRRRVTIQAYMRREVTPRVKVEQADLQAYYERFKTRYRDQRLEDVREEIEAAVRRSKFRAASEQLRAEIRKQGEFTDPERITEAVMKVVDVKYPGRGE
jgi:hypothetical protein